MQISDNYGKSFESHVFANAGLWRDRALLGKYYLVIYPAGNCVLS